MRKIGILTFHRALNCGAMLQAWALATYIRRTYSANVEVVDYGDVGSAGRKWLVFSSFRSFVGSVLSLAKDIGIEDFRRWKFKRFVEVFIPLSEKVSPTTINNMEYSHIIVGSDQVWNWRLNRHDMTYFLDFSTDAKRIAYAPSFGVWDCPENVENRVSKAIKRFDALSVREQDGREIVRQFVGYDVPIICDPTLLLPVNAYRPLERKPIITSRKYVLVYTVCGHPAAKEFGLGVAKRLKLPLIHLHGGEGARYHWFDKGRNVYTFSPSEFLWYFRNAEVIVTNSFHGAVFSILNEKRFVVFMNGNAADSRMKTLCCNLGCLDSIRYQCKAGYEIPIVDWNGVRSRLLAYRLSGMEYLEKCLI